MNRRELERSLKAGHTVVQGGKHLKIVDPAGVTVVVVGSTPSPGSRTVERARLRRAGVLAGPTRGVVVRWTHEEVLVALQEWAGAHDGRAPRQHELRNATPALPSSHQLKPFGGLRALVVEAGLPPAPGGLTRRKRRHGQTEAVNATVAGNPPVAVTEQQVTAGDNGSVGPSRLAQLVEDLERAEVAFAEIKTPYLQARDDVQLLRMEIVELLQNKNDEDLQHG